MPGKAITHGRDPFIFGGWLTEANSPEDSGLGEKKHRLLATVICAGKEFQVQNWRSGLIVATFDRMR